MKMRVFILSEGGKNIGFGHITRCIGLYQAFEERGINVEFVVNGDKSIKYLLNNTNYKIFNWLKTDRSLFNSVRNAEIVIIDSYLADIRFYQKISELVNIPVYIDDNKRINYPTGIVVNGNIYAKELNYPQNGIRYLLGSQFAPLRKEFWRAPSKHINKNMENIIITFGGEDLKNITAKVVEGILRDFPDMLKNVIIGYRAVNKVGAETAIDKNTRIIHSPNVKEMKRIMLISDIAISAGGQTLNEFARIGLPTIGICVAKNQKMNLETWQRTGFIEYAGRHDDNNILENIRILIEKLRNQKLRESKSKIGKTFVDGKGSQRIAKYLLNICNK